MARTPQSERRSSSSTWIIAGLGLTALVSLSNGFWSLANPQGNIKELKEDTQKQLGEVKASIEDLKKDLRWNFASKDLVNGKIDAIVTENKTYRDGIWVVLSRVETKANSLDSEIHGTYSPRDQFTSLNNRIMELERAVRDSAKQPVPVTQK